MLPNNTKLEAEAGDPDGDKRTFFTYNVTNLNDLKKIANREVDKFKYEGFKGGFTTFMEPAIKHGDRVNLINKKLPERNGVYQVDSVEGRLSTDGGGRQFVKLGPKI